MTTPVRTKQPNSLAALVQERDSIHAAQVQPVAGDVVKLWMLRILVRLGGMAQTTPGGFGMEEDVCRYLGLATLPDGLDSSDAATVRRELRRLHEEMEAAPPDLPAELSGNLERLGQSLVLDELEQRLLGFAILLHVEPMLADVADVLGLLSEARAHRVLADILDLTHTAVSAALHPRARLTLTCLLTPRQRGTTRLRERFQLWSDSFANQMLLAEGEPMSFLRESFSPSSPAELTLRDFEHLRGVLSLLLPYLRNSLAQARPSVNVLIHGAPGTGKTQLAKVLAVELGAELFEVSCEDEDGDPVTGGRRLIAYRVAQQALARRRSLLLFDEFEDVLGGGGFPLTGSPGGSRKAWAHKVLESNPVPTLWLGNDIASIDAAVLRRFDLVIEMPMPPQRLRRRL